MQHEAKASLKYLTKNVKSDLNLNWPNMAILFCAIIIACVGLNMDSIPVIIGAMLISPLMGPIVGIGVGIGNSDTHLSSKGLGLFLRQISIGLAGSSLYFFLSPLKEVNDQILSRTAPTMWDVLIAFFGGIAGAIATAKKDGGNVLPGVAIATALMPPLCTVGYGISQMNWRYFAGSGYLFLINSFFIVLATLLTTFYFRIHSGQKFNIPLKQEIIMLVIAVIIAIPSLISAVTIVNDSFAQAQLTQFVDTKLKGEYVASKTISGKTIKLSTIGSNLSAKKIKALQDALPDFHLGDYQLIIKQISQGNNYLTTDQFKEYIEEATQNTNSQRNTSVSDAELISLKNKVHKKFHDQINNIYASEATDQTDNQVNLLTITLKPTSQSRQAEIEKYCQNAAKKAGIKVKVAFSIAQK